MLQLDVRTLLFISALSAGVMGGALALTTHWYLHTIPGLRRWAWACGGHSLGWALLYLQDFVPALLTVVLANTVSIAAVALQYQALNEFANHRHRQRWLYVPVLLVAASFSYFTYVQPHVVMRHVVISSGTGMLLLVCARTILQQRTAPLRASAWITGGWCALVGVGALIRATLLLLFAPTTFTLFSSGLLQSITYAAGAMSILIASVGFLLMCTDRYQADLRHQATHDALTGSFNRGTIEQRLHAAWQHAQRMDTPLSVVLLDIDHFKTINDTYGHRLGDVVLQQVVARLSRHLRHHDLAGRYGGEEFVLVLPNTTLAHARDIAERVRSEITREPFIVEDAVLHCTISGGVATSSAHDSTYMSLVHRADIALYAAKHGGRNRIITDENIKA